MAGAALHHMTGLVEPSLETERAERGNQSWRACRGSPHARLFPKAQKIATVQLAFIRGNLT